MTAMRIAVFVLLSLVVAANARADWHLGAFGGASHTNTNTLALGTPATTIGGVAYEGRAFKSPQYYGLRFGRTPDRGIGIEGGIADQRRAHRVRSEAHEEASQPLGLRLVLVGSGCLDVCEHAADAPGVEDRQIGRAHV